MVGKTFWCLLKTDTTNRWCQAWRDGLQLEILGTEETHQLVMATWLNWLHLMDMEEIIIAPEETKAFMAKINEPEEIFETNKDFKEITLATGTRAMAMAMAMLGEPTSTRTLVAKEANPEILHL